MNYTYPGTYTTTTSTGSWWPPLTTNTPSIDVNNLQNILGIIHNQLNDARNEQQRLQMEVHDLRLAMDWLAKNPGMTLADYRKFTTVNDMVTDATRETLQP